MAQKRFQALGPLLAGEGSRAFIGLEHLPDGRATPVVLVWLPEGAEKDAALRERIRHETEHAAKLDHPNIVRVAGFAHLDEGHARVVEFADGESLRKLIDQVGRVPVPFAARIVCDAARGVHYAHLAGNDDGTPLMHGDLRPETMLISFTGTTKVTGYGALAFAPREHGGLRVKGRRVHTAPEQIIGGRGAMTLATDVYLLGLTLYEALVGKVPFVESADFDQAVLTEPLPPASDDIPGPLWQVISRACSKKAPDRYATPLAFREAVEAALGGVPTAEELSGYLKTVYPESDSVRAARRQAIDAGIADHVRKQWAEQSAAPAAVPSPAPGAAAASAAPKPPAPKPAAPRAPAQAAKPAPRPASPAPRPSRAIDLGPEEPSVPPIDHTRSRNVIIMIGVAVAAVIAAVMALADSSRPTPSMRRFVAEGGLDAGVRKPLPPPPPAVEDAGQPEPVVDAGLAVVPTPVPAPTPTPTPAPQEKSGFGVLEFDVDPNCELSVDDKPLGRSPIKVTLPVGRKTVKIVNKERGISTSRTVTISGGETTSENVRIGQGFVQISAPDGAQVFIDGIRIGSAPIRGEVPVYEGSHKIQVTIGNSKWNEAFSVREGKRVSFQVNLQ